MSSISYREETEPDIPFLAKLRAANSGTEEGWMNRISGYLNGTVNPQKAFLPLLVFQKNNTPLLCVVCRHCSQAKTPATRTKGKPYLSFLMSAISYREVTEPDIPFLAKLRAANSGTEESWTTRISGYLNGTVNPQKALPPRIIYVATDTNRIIGFIAGHLTRRYDCEGELQWIDVAIEYRRSGVASHLVKLLANWFIDQKAFKVCIDPGNETARQFYKKNGAEELNEHWLYWKDLRVVFNQ